MLGHDVVRPVCGSGLCTGTVIPGKKLPCLVRVLSCSILIRFQASNGSSIQNCAPVHVIGRLDINRSCTSSSLVTEENRFSQSASQYCNGCMTPCQFQHLNTLCQDHFPILDVGFASVPSCPCAVCSSVLECIDLSQCQHLIITRKPTSG